MLNEGIGTAIAVRTCSATADAEGSSPSFDLSPEQSRAVPTEIAATALVIQFEKFGREYRVELPLALDASPSIKTDDYQSIPAAVSRKRIAAQRLCRKQIDQHGNVIGSSRQMLEVFEQIQHANAIEGLPAVLLLGEAGVGKTHIAELIHKSSTRTAKPFHDVNAGSGGGDINIQRGEWIGYGKNHGIQHIDKNGHPGHLIKAHGGSLFVDEFASLSLDLQIVFLSVLDKRAIQKVGGESFMPDVRCIFATNANVNEAIANGTLRKDLLDRIPVRFHIPPLRERRSDILQLARYFAGEHEIAHQCLIALLRYDWPGNVRELKSKVVAAVARMKGDGKSTLNVTHFDLPGESAGVVNGLGEEACQRELWTLADEIARNEGFERGTGLQHRAGEIMGVGDSQASKMFQAFGLSPAASA